MTRRVAVVGAGAVGVTAAHDLASRGADVTVFERDAVGAGSTARAAGIAYHAHAEDVDAAVMERAIERFRALSGEGRFRFTETPYLWFVTEADATADALREQVERMAHHGCDASLVDPSDLRARFPQLHTDDVHLAAVAETAGVADPDAYAALLAARARDAGAEIREGATAALRTDPVRVVVNGESARFDDVVVAAGPHTAPLLGDAGFDVPVEPYRAQAVRTAGPAVPIFYDATDRYYVRPDREGLLAGDGAGPTTLDDWDRNADAETVAELRAAMEHRLVNFDADMRDSWAGLCTATPDRDPVLGRLAEGVHVAAGWHGSGFMRAPATGEAVAESVLDGEGVPAFDPARFDGGEAATVPRGIDDAR
ncbi:MAG: NAD(P)/FAD-dependent oxidoreductase [Halobacteriaceae archaeon]